ncbi:MAG TPA: hypothetical protein VI299_20910 [Polyangiales bacterium]
MENAACLTMQGDGKYSTAAVDRSARAATKALNEDRDRIVSRTKIHFTIDCAHMSAWLTGQVDHQRTTDFTTQRKVRHSATSTSIQSSTAAAIADKKADSPSTHR